MKAESIEAEVDWAHQPVNWGVIRCQERFGKKSKIKSNSEMGAKEIKIYCQLNYEAEQVLKLAVDSMKLSARSYHRLLKIARTIADLSGETEINSNHIAEALQYRPKEKTY